MAEANVLPNEEISSPTSPRNEGTSLNDQSFGWLGTMTREEVNILQTDENQAFCMAVMSGNVTEVRSMLNEKPNLVTIKINGMLLIHMAASRGHYQMLRLLVERTGFDYLDRDQKVRLFFTTIKNSIFDVAYEMALSEFTLAHSRDEEGLTPLHVLARKPMDNFDIGKRALDLIGELWRKTRDIEYNQMLEFLNTPSLVLFDAAKSKNLFILEILLDSNPELLMIVDSKRRTLFHIAVLHRQSSVLFYLMNQEIFKNLVMQAVDDNGNNILHMAGMVSPDQRFALSRPDILMQAELLWFKEVEKRVPTGYKSMRNKEGHTPEDIFYSTHKDFMISANLAMKDKANYGMVVATIVATMVFSASVTVPGHDDSPKGGFVIFQKHGWFIAFFVSNSVSLLSSSASTIFFLTVLTSSYAEDEFNSSLLLRLTCGVTTLFVAITTMVVAFTAACFLIFNRYSTWVAYLVASLSCLTVALFVFLLYTLFHDLIGFLYWFRAYRHHPQPPNCDRLKSRALGFFGLI